MPKKSKYIPSQSKSPPIRPQSLHHKNRWKIEDQFAFVTLFLSTLILAGIIVTAVSSLPSNQPTLPDSPKSLTVISPSLPTEPSPSDKPPAPPRPQTNSSSRLAVRQDMSDASQLLRFSSTQARDIFLNKNSLSIDQLTFIAALNVYSTNFTPSQLDDGVELYSNHAYSALLTPTDPLFGDQWYLPDIRSPEAWNHQAGSSNVVTAVIDTGFALSHEDLTQKWYTNQNETGNAISEGPIPNCSSRSLSLNKNCNNIDDDSDGYVDNSIGWSTLDDDNNVQAGRSNSSSPNASHGTIVASMIGASTNNGRGTSGANWRTSLMPIKALDDTGSGTTLSVALGIRYAADHGANVINLSLGSSESDPILAEQIAYAISNGVTVVAAAGNDGCDCIAYPARYNNVIAVGASNASRQRASFSSYGSGLSLVAPGTAICSASWSASQPTNRYSCGHNGTSFSSPLVAAAAATLLAQDSSLSPSQIKTALTNGAAKLAAMSGQARSDQYGYGLLDNFASLSLVSAPVSRGIILNTHEVAQTAPLSNIRHDSLNTTCEARGQSTCYVRAVNIATNETIAIGNSASGSELNLYWSTQSKALAPGTWIIQLFNVTVTSQSLVREDTIVISP